MAELLFVPSSRMELPEIRQKGGCRIIALTRVIRFVVINFGKERSQWPRPRSARTDS